MAHVENQIRKTIEKFLGDCFDRLATERIKEIEDALAERQTRIEHLEGSVHRHLEVIIGMGGDVLPMIREKVVDIMTEVKDRGKRIAYRLEKISKTRGDFDTRWEGQVVSFTRKNESWSPEMEEVHGIVQSIDDFEMRIGGQQIVISIRNSPDLQDKTERLYHRIDLEGYRKKNREKISEVTARREILNREEQDRLDGIRRKIDSVISPFVSVLVERIGELNIPRNEMFQEFVTAIESISSIKIEIQEVIPDFDYDLLYANYLQASEEQNENLLRSIGIQVFPNVDFYQMGMREVKRYLEANYFR